MSALHDHRPRNTAHWAACTLLGIALAAFAAHVNKWLALPAPVFWMIWLGIAGLLGMTLARATSDALASHTWTGRVFAVLLLALAVAAPFKATATGFARHDEIYSWGMWAVQHALRQPHDLYYTGSDYPQLFPYELASVFLAQQSHVSHFFAKLVVAIPVIVMVALQGQWLGRSTKPWVNALGLVLCGLAFAAFGNVVFWAYADPLASAFLLCSFALLLQHAQSPRWPTMALAAACGLAASLTKQPGLIWCVVSLPLYVLWGVWRRHWPKANLAPVLLALGLALIWPLLLATDFTQNGGVLDIARQNGGFIASAALSFQRYVLQSLDLGLLLVACALLAMRSPSGRVLWLLFVLPYLAIWFTVGSYERRHGLHVVMISLMLLNHLLLSRHGRVLSSHSPRRPWAWPVACLSLLAASTALAYHRHAPALQDGNLAMFKAQFGQQGIPIFQAMLREQSPVFAASNYQYGALFNRVPLVRPQSGESSPSTATVREALRQSQAAYAFTSGEWAYGPYSGQIDALAAICPEALGLLLQTPAKPQLKIYRVNQPALANCMPK